MRNHRIRNRQCNLERARLIQEAIKIMTGSDVTFIDLFAGCGGISLGLMNAGWKGIFAVEKEKNAFETLKHNLIDSKSGPCYKWPHWLQKEPIGISRLLKKYQSEIKSLKGKVDMVVGGPPCQGFSLVGKRRKNDPRNRLFIQYVEFVKLVQPRLVLMENVKGITVEFGKKKNSSIGNKRGRRAKPFADRIRKTLEEGGYEVYPSLIRAVDFGVPQIRPRYFLVGVQKPIPAGFGPLELKSAIDKLRRSFLQERKLPIERNVSTKDALSDLETNGRAVMDCVDSPGFKQVFYGGPQSEYQRLLHGSMNGSAPNSLRLANHRQSTISRFEEILRCCRPGVTLSDGERARLGTRKHCIVVLHPDKPSHTLTTLPDDFVHYSEPRILTVREYARLQSFPDWFEFRGAGHQL